MKKKIIITVLSFIAGIGLIYFGLKIFLTKEQINILFSLPIDFHLYSVLLILPIYLIAGIESFALYKLVYNKKISWYDIITLPYVIGMWGFLIPIQGAYLYNSLYFKAKYNILIVNTTSIYLLSLSVGFFIAGFIGIIFSYYDYQNIYFLLVSAFLLIHPLFVLLFLKLIGILKIYCTGIFTSNKKPAILFRLLITKIETVFTDYVQSINTRNLLTLTGINLVNSVLFAFWSLWIAKNFGFDLSFFQLLLFSCLIKLTLLFKLTPGNLGINQFASSGIILLVGGTAASGFAISLYQTSMILIMVMGIGAIFSLINLKVFSIK